MLWGITERPTVNPGINLIFLSRFHCSKHSWVWDLCKGIFSFHLFHGEYMLRKVAVSRTLSVLSSALGIGGYSSGFDHWLHLSRLVIFFERKQARKKKKRGRESEFSNTDRMEWYVPPPWGCPQNEAPPHRIIPYYSMYTWKMMYFPSPFPFPYTKVKHPLSPQCRYLSSRFCNCIQKFVMSVRLSWEFGLKKPRTILFLFFRLPL